MAVTTRLELSRQALAGLQDKKGHRLAGIMGAIEAIKEQHSEGAGAQQLEDSFALAFRVADLEALQRSLLEKENKELRELSTGRSLPSTTSSRSRSSRRRMQRRSIASQTSRIACAGRPRRSTPSHSQWIT